MNMRKKHCILLGSFLILAILLAGLYECEVFGKDNSRQKDYGVFLSLDASDMDRITEYQTVVIDAQYFSKKDIAYLKKQGCTVYSYINIGAIENFREYYDEYSNLALGDYENWEEEKWVDVSSTVWQNFLVSLEEELLDKSIDGFFVDNCDVYYVYHTDDVFEGLTTILEHLMEYGKPVIINGGDTYVMEYETREGSIQRIMTGVNQECVFSRINFKKDSFSAQKKTDREYFQDYIETCDRQGCDVYLIEYTTDCKLRRKIKKYCKKNRFHYYISDSIELD